MNLRRALFISVAILIIVPTSQVWALGMGIVLGEPTGVCVKQWLPGGTALAGAAAWSFEDESAFHVHADYLFHNDGISSGDVGKTLLYFGVGGRLKIEEKDTSTGIRFPLGVDYVFASHPVDVFFEIAPLLDVAPATEFRVNGGLGIRYYF